MIYRAILLVLLTGLAACQSNQPSDARFTPIGGAESGVTFNNKMQPFENDTLNANTYDPMYNGAGVGVGDFNRDGRLDLFFAGNNVTSRLYLNRTEPGKDAFKFEDVTKKAGVTTAAWCTGVSVADVNQDGWPDIYVSVAGRDTARAMRHNLLFINEGIRGKGKGVGDVPTFREMARDYGLDDSGMNTQAAFFDYDRDGDLDCYVLNNAVERTGRNTIRPKRLNGEGPSTDRLYRNETSNAAGKPPVSNKNRRLSSRVTRFTDVSREAGILAEGYGLGLTVADINQDGWPDVYCANDFLSNDVVYVNDRNGHFTDRSRDYFKHTSYNSMGVDIQDVNNDTRPDVMVVDMLPETNERQKMMLIKTNWEFFHLARQQGYQDEYVRNTLQLNMGQERFSEIGQLAGVFRTDWSWAPLLADFDNDGYKDLFVTNGYRRDITNLDYVAYLNSQAASFGNPAQSSRRQTLAELYKLPEIKLHNYMFRNRSGEPGGELTFADESENWGFGEKTFSNGAAYADLDNDGDLDLIINNMDSEAGLYRNETNRPGQPIANHALRLHLPADAHGLGAEVRVRTPDGQTQAVAVHPVRGYASSVEPFVHVGLGKHTAATVEIRWADGAYQRVGQLPADRMHEIVYKPNASAFSVVPAAVAPLFSTADAASAGLTFRHEEAPLNDLERTPLLPQVYAKNSPAIAIADADGNGLDDVFVGADAGQVRSLFLQTKPGQFAQRVQGANDLEDMGSLFFDADGDGDQDLYVVSGGSRLPDSSGIYQDRLYLNDGTGKLTRAEGVLPPTTSSGSCVVAADFDGDGDLDLFRAGRVKVGQYPLAPRSYLLRNDGKRFTDVTDQLAPGLRYVGMTCAALWTDFDNDNDPDLMLAGEFMPITVFTNERGRLVQSVNQSLSQYKGLWNSLTGADFDQDGDVDYIAGNLGLNTRYRVSSDEPLRVYAKDFDGNGQLDPILTQYLQGKEHIVPIRDLLNDQMPTLSRKRFTSYQQYARQSFDDAFSDNTEGATMLSATELRSCYIENKGNGEFAIRPLPTLAQLSPVFGMQTGDFNADGLPDALLVGNSYAPETYTGWYDAGRGCLLLGDGRGNFRPVMPADAGLAIDRDAKAFAALSTGQELLYLVANNNGPLQLIRPVNPIRPQPAKPGETHRLVKQPNGKTQRVEFYHGSGYLSQSSR
ncbi:VCBS repeat-containing protein [Spirosoma montaniterrae]|nr:VCBS repeat-containing protein [Spirosoma montaniterrae]